MPGQPARADDAAIPPEIEKLLALPEDKIDIGLAALTFAHDVSPDSTDIQAYSERIDRLVEEVRSLKENARAQGFQVSDGPDDTMRAIMEVFYKREGFKYDHSANSADNDLNYFLPGILERKLGVCTTMPMLYMAIAQRLGLQMYVVQSAAHNFLRILDPRSTIKNFEATSNTQGPDAFYIEKEHITDAEIKSGAYMRTLTHHRYLAELLATNASYWEAHGQAARAINYYEKAYEIDPQSPQALIPLMQIYLGKAMTAEDDEVFNFRPSLKRQIEEYLNKALYYRGKLNDLGVRLDDYVDQGKEKNAKVETQ